MFNLITNTSYQRRLVEEAISQCTFPYERLLPKLKSEQHKDLIPVEWRNLAQGAAALSHSTYHKQGIHPIVVRQQTLGLAWYSGKIELDLSLEHTPSLAKEVFLAESAHMVDFFYITPEQRAEMFKIFHHGDTTPHDHGWFEETGNQNYWAFVGEAWMGGFIQAYTELEPSLGNFEHKINEAEAQQIREILTPAGSGMPPAIPNPMGSVWALYTGKVYHDHHKSLEKGQLRFFPSSAEARVAGLKPCRVCKPK